MEQEFRTKSSEALRYAQMERKLGGARGSGAVQKSKWQRVWVVPYGGAIRKRQGFWVL